MTSGDFRIMQWHSAMDGPWSSEAARRFQQQGYGGLVLIPNVDWTPDDLEFLQELKGLRLFSFTGKVRNDLAAFKIESLEDLTLVTGSRLGVPDNTLQPRLSRLCLNDRPGINVQKRWPKLRSLRVGTWKGSDLRMLEHGTELSHVYLEGRRQQGELDGIQDCSSVQSLILINYSVGSTEALSDLHHLSELKLLAAKPTPEHGTLDLSNLTSPQLSKLWISNADHLRHLESLAQLPMLREVRLIGCHLSEADMRAISSLPARVRVQLVSD